MVCVIILSSQEILKFLVCTTCMCSLSVNLNCFLLQTAWLRPHPVANDINHFDTLQCFEALANATQEIMSYIYFASSYIVAS